MKISERIANCIVRTCKNHRVSRDKTVNFVELWNLIAPKEEVADTLYFVKGFGLKKAAKLILKTNLYLYVASNKSDDVQMFKLDECIFLSKSICHKSVDKVISYFDFVINNLEDYYKSSAKSTLFRSLIKIEENKIKISKFSSKLAELIDSVKNRTLSRVPSDTTIRFNIRVDDYLINGIKEITEQSIESSNKTLNEIGFDNTDNVVLIISSTNNSIVPYQYVYKFENGNINLFRLPLVPVKLERTIPKLGEYFVLYDNSLETESVVITRKSVISFEVFGNEMIKSSSKTGGGASLAGAIIGGILFGTTGAVIGSSVKTNVDTVHEIVDSRKTELYLEDGTSIIFEGIKFYQELKKNISQKSELNITENSNSIIQKNLDSIEELKKLKELLDLNIITEDEFNLKKKQLLKL
ncbi:hypothetical protein RI065_06540 [Mycoplasmatota bacterium zrk1]